MKAEISKVAVRFVIRRYGVIVFEQGIRYPREGTFNERKNQVLAILRDQHRQDMMQLIREDPSRLSFEEEAYKESGNNLVAKKIETPVRTPYKDD